MDRSSPLLRTDPFVLYQKERQGKRIVVKVFEQNSLEAFREIETHRSASKLTSGVLRFMGEVVEKGKVGFEMEHCSLSLKTLCDQHRVERCEWNEIEVMDIGTSMLEILQRLHNVGLVHNRIAVDSWLLTDGNEHKLRLSDFSEARFVRRVEGQPALAEANDKFSQDVRGLGHVFYYLVMGRAANYAETIPRDLMGADLRRKFRQLHYSDAFSDLLLRMFSRSISLSDCQSSLQTISQTLP